MPTGRGGPPGSPAGRVGSLRGVLAVVPVRAGALPAGGAEAVAEADGRALVVGDGTVVAAEELIGVARRVDTVELGAFLPGAWAAALAVLLADEPAVLLPACPDGRDLAPRLAFELGRPLYAGAVAVARDRATLARHGGLVLEEAAIGGPFVATLVPGVRGVDAGSHAAHIEVRPAPNGAVRTDATVLEVLPPDVATMDLSEAPRILGGGAGLADRETFEALAELATALKASMGATRVITDRGWLGHERQIGTTGVVVSPRLYLAFGISGAVQHTSGLGNPDHVISVNTDPHCPMMQLADLAIVADANEVVAELHARLCGGAHG